MKKQMITFIALCFALVITAAIHGAVNKIEPMESPFKLWIQIWFGVGLVYFVIWGIKGLRKNKKE